MFLVDVTLYFIMEKSRIIIYMSGGGGTTTPIL